MGEEAQMTDIPTKTPVKEPGMAIDSRIEKAESSASTDVGGISRESLDPPMSPRNFKNPFSRVQTSLDMDDYFVCSCVWKYRFT
jgi:hypothetical protein